MNAAKPILKDCLYPGRHHLPDGRTFICEPQDIPHYAKRFKDWISARLPIPVRWEHELADATLSAAEKAQNTFSHAVDANVHADGYLEVKFPADDEDDRKKLPKVKYVSPTIKWDVVDRTGKLWPGPSITEIALTPVPIQDQKPFLLSQADPAMAPVYLSNAAPSYEPIKPVRLAAGAPPMDDDKNPKAAEPAPEEKPDDGAMPEEDEDAGLGQKRTAALQCLADHGIVLGEDTGDDLETFFSHIITACATKSAAENPTDMAGPAGGDGQGQGANEVQPPVMMSAALAKVHRENIKLRIDKLWARKQINKRILDKMLAELKTVKLSMTADGEPIEQGLLAKVAAYEDLEENATPFKRYVDLSGATEVEEPDEAANPARSEKRQREVGAELGALANGTAKPRTNHDRL